VNELNLTRRTVLSLLSAAPLAAWPSWGQAQSLPLVKFMGAAPVPRPDLGFMWLGIPLEFYHQLGVEAEFNTVAGSSASIQLVATNSAQICHCGMQELMEIKKKQPDLPVHAVYLQDVGAAYEIVVSEDSPIHAITELKGKRIGVVNLGSGAVPFVKAMLSHANVDPNSVELLPVGTGAQALAAYNAHRVDALSLFRGQHAQLENLGMKLRYFTAPYPSGVLAANDAFLKENRAAVVHALQGVVLNCVFMIANPEAAVRAYFKMFGAPKGDMEQALREGAHSILRSAELWKDPKSSRKWGMMTDQDWLGLAQFTGFDLEPSQLHNLYTDELIDDVNKVDVNIALRAAKAA
jgi:NitT/TauT family transport system substrate-binding protein